jgi:hypothetical protein
MGCNARKTKQNCPPRSLTVFQVDFTQKFSHQKFCLQYEFIIIWDLHTPNLLKPSKISTNMSITFIKSLSYSIMTFNRSVTWINKWLLLLRIKKRHYIPTIPPVWLQKDVNPRPHDFENFVTSAKFLQGLYGNNSTITYLCIYPQHSSCLYILLS